MNDESLSRESLWEFLEFLAPDFRLLDAQRATLGHSIVYRLEVDDSGLEAGDSGLEVDDSGLDRADESDRRVVVLKAAPPDGASGIATEPRLLTLLDRETDIPVPTVHGVLDEHDTLPTPAFLMDAVPGVIRAQPDVLECSDAELASIARQTGRHLATLHDLDAVDRFGFVTVSVDRPLRGAVPDPDPAAVSVAAGHDDWSDCLDAWVEHELETLADAGHVSLAERLSGWFEDRIAAVPDDIDPVLARVDHGVHNLCVDPDTHHVTGLIDWAFTLAATPGYDLQCVTYVLSGAVLAHCTGAPDRRQLVREAVLEGYRARSADPVVPDLDSWYTYEVCSVVRALNFVESGTAALPDGTESSVRAGLLEELETALLTAE